MRGASERGLELPDVDGFRSVPGRGAKAVHEGAEVWVGRTGDGYSAAAAAILADWEQAGQTAVVVERDGQLIGALALADTVKPEAAGAVAQLKDMGIDVWLLTGDNRRAARSVASSVGIDHVFAEVSPADKLDEITKLQLDGHRVGMVGDGVNDAAALAQANLGIAMGTGAGVAIEAADINVLSGDLLGVPRALGLARATYTVILQNLGWAFGYNLIALPLAASGLLNPALAAVAMGASSITVVANSLRLRRFGAADRRGRRGRTWWSTGTRSRYARIAAMTLAPAVILGGLVLGVPNTFAVASTASHTFRGPDGESVQVQATPLTAGSVYVHVYLYGTTNTSSISGRVPITATSAAGARATATVYSISPDHEFGVIHLRTGVWNLHVSVRDAKGIRIGGAFAVPVNVISSASAAKPGSAANRGGASANVKAGSVPTAKLAADQLSVADELGPDIVAAWVSHHGGRLNVEVRTLSVYAKATAVPITIAGAARGSSCGVGCQDLSLPASTTALVVHATIGDKSYSRRLPVAFVAGANQRATEIMQRVDAAQAKLRGATVHQVLADSPTQVVVTNLQIAAPDRFAYQVQGTQTDDTVVVGTREWDRTGSHSWQLGSYGPKPFSASSYLKWWSPYSGKARLIDVYRSGGAEYADVADLAEIPQLGPVWFRFHVDLTTQRVERLRMITLAHFMTQTWGSFNDAPPITPPTRP